MAASVPVPVHNTLQAEQKYSPERRYHRRWRNRHRRHAAALPFGDRELCVFRGTVTPDLTAHPTMKERDHALQNIVITNNEVEVYAENGVYY